MGEELKRHIHRRHWTEYMHNRVGDYAFRSRTRYKAVADILFALGLDDSHLIVDIGAGSCQFDHYLRVERRWCGRYLPVDAVLDGTDLETWTPKLPADFFVCIEVLEHLKEPTRMIEAMMGYASRGAVATTPNSAVIDVLTCDPTHISVVPVGLFKEYGWEVDTQQLFAKPDDTIVAYWEAGR